MAPRLYRWLAIRGSMSILVRLTEADAAELWRSGWAVRRASVWMVARMSA